MDILPQSRAERDVQHAPGSAPERGEGVPLGGVERVIFGGSCSVSPGGTEYIPQIGHGWGHISGFLCLHGVIRPPVFTGKTRFFALFISFP